MITRNMVADFCHKVVLAITEKLIEFIEDDGVNIHHLDFFEFNQLKDTARGSDENFWSFLSGVQFVAFD